jgi:2,3-bisphosphoglycerate-independent phosphoglycerate mutase
VLHAPGTTGSYDSNFAAKAAAAAEALVNQDYDFVLLHVKAVDDTGHDRLLAMKVRYLEVVDRMIGHLLVALHDAEVAQEQQQQQKEEEDDKVDVEQQRRQQQQQDVGQQRPVQRYAVCVTGDHSTPVLFGDHSHEPVPVALARVCDTVTAMGGLSQLELRRAHMGERLPLPDMANPPPIEELRRQADAQVARRRAAADGVAWTPGVAAESGWREAWPAVAACDAVLAYNELSAARGCLGRFTGAGVMPLIKQFCGWQR